MTNGRQMGGRFCKFDLQPNRMSKWLTAIFALFLSVQVFGARGKAVDKFLGSYFSFDTPDTVCRVQTKLPAANSRNFWIMPACNTRVEILFPVSIHYFYGFTVSENISKTSAPYSTPRKEMPVAIFPALK